MCTTYSFAQVDVAFNDIKIKGLKRGVYIIKLIDNNYFNSYPVHFIGIKVVDSIPHPKKNIVGLAEKKPNQLRKWYDGTIYLKRNLLYNQTVLEVVLAHEIGHLLGLQHDKEITIMQPIAITQRGDENYNKMYKNDQAIWDQYFKKLKSINN